MKNNVLQESFDAAAQFYNLGPPEVIGRLVLSQADATLLPLNLEDIYGTVFDAVNAAPQQAMAHAKTFGALNVGVALNGQETRYSFDRAEGYKPASMAEITTSRNKSLEQLFIAPDVDASCCFLLADDKQPTSVELGLIQALHMVDTALVTGNQLNNKVAIRLVDQTELLTLRQKYPDDVFLRMYGDVRKKLTQLKLLGSVVPTSIIEKSGITTRRFESTKSEVSLPKRESIRIAERQPASFLGITIAKRPHIGHGLLLVKAIAESGKGGTLCVELNDRGSRVMAAVATLAKNQDSTLDETMTALTQGMISFDSIEQAYRQRSEAPNITPPLSFKLKTAEDYYRTLLEQIMPAEVNCVITADSDVAATRKIEQTSGFTPLFSEGGMSLLRGTSGDALVVERSGELTVPGILGSLSTEFALRLVDSPPPLNATNRTIFKDNGLTVQQSEGTGILIDFAVASGTNGSSKPLEELISETAKITGEPRFILPILRQVMNDGYLLPGDGASLSLNFATTQAVTDACLSASEKIAAMADPEALLFQPIKPTNIKQRVLKSVMKAQYNCDAFTGKVTGAQIAAILGCFPQLRTAFSKPLLTYLDPTFAEATIPRNFFTSEDRRIVDDMRIARAESVIPNLLQLSEIDRPAFDALVTQSELLPIMKTMGYDLADAPRVLQTLLNVKGLYRIS